MIYNKIKNKMDYVDNSLYRYKVSEFSFTCHTRGNEVR